MTDYLKKTANQKKSPPPAALRSVSRSAHDIWSLPLHFVAWLFVAGIAVTYLYSLFQSQTPQSARIADAAKPAQAEIDGQAPLVNQIAALRAQIRALKQRELVFETRLADLQTALGPLTASLGSNLGNAGNRRGQVGGSVKVAHSAMPNSGFGDIFLTNPKIPKASSGQPTRTLFGVDLGEHATLDDLRERWLRLVANHPPQLKELEVRYVLVGPEVPAGKNRVKLIAGPFSNAAAAAVLCAKLQTRKLSCQQTIFAGNKLESADPSLPDRRPRP